MRILLISGKDLAGGANRAAFRLHHALRNSGTDSVMVVRTKLSHDPHIYAANRTERGLPPCGKGYLDMIPQFLLSSQSLFSTGWQGIDLPRLIRRFKPDILHLHWINGGVVSVQSLQSLRVPVVWTFHDMWTFTGGCHYAGECRGYIGDCGRCPQLRPFPILQALASCLLTRKKVHWKTIHLRAVAPSRWMKSRAVESSLFCRGSIEVIPNCCDSVIFNPEARIETRHNLGLAKGDLAFLFVNANQERKGACHIAEIVQRLKESDFGGRIKFLFVGPLSSELQRTSEIISLPPTSSEKKIASYYAASDLYLLPSLEDNLPNVILEALSCGTPVAAFPTGGIPEMISHGINGLVSSQSTAESLASTIIGQFTSISVERSQIAAMAHSTYSEKSVAARHLEFYQTTLDSGRFCGL